MSILSSTKSGVYKVIKEWLDANNITNYKIQENKERQNKHEPMYIIDVDGDVNLIGYKNSDPELSDSKLPSYIKFGVITGSFICSYSRLTSMRGFPETVGKNLDISFSRISLLEYVPKIVNNFIAFGLPFSEQQIREKIIKEIEIKIKVYC
ncbi:MAG: hypothetical protein K5660_03365 [Paludibacteraceae bacterium]|nr:hypothetical protein [Paludibacteraceae bacterium]